MTQAYIQIRRTVQEKADRMEAARRIKDGEVVGQFVRGVCILWIDAQNREAVKRIYAIKGARRVGRPFSVLLETNSFISILDKEAIHPGLHAFFFDPDELEDRLGALCMIRAPIRKAAADKLPGYAYTTAEDGSRWVQSWVPCGHKPGRQLLEEMWSIGIRLPGVTSMNVSGDPEIVEQDDALAFCEDHDVPLFLQDFTGYWKSARLLPDHLDRLRRAAPGTVRAFSGIPVQVLAGRNRYRSVWRARVEVPDYQNSFRRKSPLAASEANPERNPRNAGWDGVISAR